MGDLTSKQRAAISALLEGQTVTAAAAVAGVGRQTVHRWLTDPAFKAAMREGSDGAIMAAAVRLAAMVDVALTAIAEIIDNPTTTGAAVRLRAADAVVGHVLKLQEQADVLARLAALESKQNEY